MKETRQKADSSFGKRGEFKVCLQDKIHGRQRQQSAMSLAETFQNERKLLLGAKQGPRLPGAAVGITERAHPDQADI